MQSNERPNTLVTQGTRLISSTVPKPRRQDGERKADTEKQPKATQARLAYHAPRRTQLDGSSCYRVAAATFEATAKKRQKTTRQKDAARTTVRLRTNQTKYMYNSPVIENL